MRVTHWGSPLPRAGGSEAKSAPLWAGLITRDELMGLSQFGIFCDCVSSELSPDNVPKCHHTPGAGTGWGDQPWWLPKPAQGFGGLGTASSPTGRKEGNVTQTPRETQAQPWGTAVTRSHLPGVTPAQNCDKPRTHRDSIHPKRALSCPSFTPAPNTHHSQRQPGSPPKKKTLEEQGRMV